MTNHENGPGTIPAGEHHPAADLAMAYMRTVPLNELLLLRESFASCAIEGNRLSEICGETLERLLDGRPVSDRYLLGLAWMVREARLMDEDTTIPPQDDLDGGPLCPLEPV